MIISYRRHFIFIHLHKTGGDSVSAALLPVLGPSDFVLKSDWQAWVQSVRSGRQHAELADLRKHSPARTVANAVGRDVWGGAFTFAFVRHPVARTVSLYKYAARKAEERNKPIPRNAWYLTRPGRRSDPLRWPSVRAYLDAPAFSDFIRHPLLDRDLSMVPQWFSVSDESGDKIVDFLGRFEHLEEDFHVVQDRIGIARSPLGRRNASRHPRGVEVSADDRAYLVRRFDEDYARLGYDRTTNA